MHRAKISYSIYRNSNNLNFVVRKQHEHVKKENDKQKKTVTFLDRIRIIACASAMNI